MIIFKDFISGDELFSDTYPMKLVGEHKTIYEVQGQRTTQSNKFDESAIGANPSAEEAAEGVDESAVSGVNIVLNNRLTEIEEFKKKDYQTKVKSYVTTLLQRRTKQIEDLKEEGRKDKAAELQEEMDHFKANFTSDLKEIFLSGFKAKEFQFFLGESLDTENGMISLMTYPPEDKEGRPIMYFIKFGLKDEKV